MTTPRQTLAYTLAAFVFALPGAPAWAQDAWPNKPIRLVVPFSAGGTSDILARTIGEKLQTALKQTVVIDNKAGAGGVIGADIVAKAPPDGYTLLAFGSVIWLAGYMQDNVPFEPFRDFAPITLGTYAPNLLVIHPAMPVRSVKEL
ncbi:MAG: tripartite tricarboxylate transporter substrate binding protein, partial [Rhizobacter sp.]|nr:tripartite tricarboxylate transporter substrate binding protein [Rhizobacter sp.]